MATHAPLRILPAHTSVDDSETILYAESDPEAVIKQKWKSMRWGDYSRADVVRLMIAGEKKDH